MTRPSRLQTCLALALACLVSAWSSSDPARASDYPTRPVRVIVPFPAGGGTDALARLLTQKLAVDWGQQFVVENRPGAAGLAGGGVVGNAAPDGYTLLFTAFGGVNTATMSKLTPVVLVATNPNVLVVTSSMQARTLSDLIRLARDRPKSLNFASSGVGSLSHLSGELLKSLAKIDVVHVPYKGMAQAVGDLLGSHIQFVIAPLSTVATLIEDGKLRALAVTSRARVGAIPDVPTVAESGIADFEAINWFGILAPAATDPAVVTKLNLEIGRLLRSEEVRRQLTISGADPGGGSAESFGELIRADLRKWNKVAQDVGLSTD